MIIIKLNIHLTTDSLKEKTTKEIDVQSIVKFGYKISLFGSKYLPIYKTVISEYEALDMFVGMQYII